MSTTPNIDRINEIKAAETAHLKTLLKAARKHIDPVIQYRLIEAIDAAIGDGQGVGS